jgi:flagellin
MSSVIYTNTASLVAQKNLLGAQNALATSVERLSSGLRINRARDDAAGLSVANSLQTQINGANQGIRNMNDAISMVQTAEGAIAAASDMAQRILTLATQAANDTLSKEARGSIKEDMQNLIKSIDSIGSRTTFAGNKLLEANLADSTNESYYSMQISNNSTDKINLSGNAFRNIGLGSFDYKYTAFTMPVTDLDEANTSVTNTVFVKAGAGATYLEANLTTTYDASGVPTFKLNDVAYTSGASLFNREIDTSKSVPGLARNLSNVIGDAVDPASFANVQDAARAYLTSLDSQRSTLGSYQNQMEYTLSNITELSANLSASRSRVIDTDYAAETASLTRGQILQQAATAMLAQANQMPNVILTLLK